MTAESDPVSVRVIPIDHTGGGLAIDASHLEEGDVRKLLVGSAISIGVVAASAAPAFGHDCFNASKKNPDAANAGTVTITPPDGFSFTPSGHAGNPAFATVTIAGAGTFENVFAHPAGPHEVLPAARNCDGKGIDSIDACLSG